MRIEKKVISELAAKGIEVKYYPTGLEGMKKDAYERRVNYVKNFAEGQSVWDGSKYIDAKSSIQDIEAYAKKYVADKFDDGNNFDYYEGRRWYDSTTLYICYNDKMIVKKENQKSKEITTDYVVKLIEKNEKAYSGLYGAFALNMQKLLKANGLSNRFSIYPTTYGIGIWVLYNWTAKDDINLITNILDAKGVEYYNEYSEAGWVYRYKVSKKADNLAKVA